MRWGGGGGTSCLVMDLNPIQMNRTKMQDQTGV